MEALDSFNAHFSGALLALAESRLGDAFSEYRDLAEIAAGVAVPVPAQTNRRSTHGPGSAGRTSAPPQRENPIIEMVLAVRDRLGAALLERLRDPAVDIEDAKDLWRWGALMGVEAVTSSFSSRLCVEFSEASREFIKTVAASQVFRSVVGGQSEGLGLEQPYVAVIADVLSLCVQWFDGVMHECLRDGTPLPNRARSAVVTELHSQCIKISVPLLTSYLEAKKVLELVDAALEGPPGGTHNAAVAVSPGSASKRDASSPSPPLQWERAVAMASGKYVARAGSSGGSASLRSPEGEGGGPDDHRMAQVNEVAEQLSFICQLLERYLRAVSEALLLGAEGAASQLRCDLSTKMQEMIGHYVVLERAYVQWSVSRAVHTAVQRPFDDGMEMFSWVDDVFFICKTALGRSLRSQSQMATAATLNNVHAALEDIADATLSSAVLIAGQSSAIAATSTPPPTDDAEAQLSAAFAGLLSDSAFDAAAAASAALNTVNLGQEYMAALLKWIREAIDCEFPACATMVEPLLSELQRLEARFKTAFHNGADAFGRGLLSKLMPPFLSLVRKSSYILTLEEYERFTSRDPVTDALSSLLCQVTADTVLGVLSESSVDAILPVIATCITTDVEAVFTQKQLNELGAHRLQATVRMAFDTLSSRMSRGSLRSQFTRLQQCLSLWSLEKLPDVYLLKFHSPAIGAGEVKALLRVRADFNPLGVDGVMLDRLQCVKELRKP